MIKVRLPNNNIKEFEAPISILDLAKEISISLSKATLGGVVDNKLKDSDYLIKEDCALKIVTAKDKEGLEIIRHSVAHILAQAVKELYPEAQVTIGPVIENGFYYDFSYSNPFTLEDLKLIENKMREIVKANLPIKRIELSRDEAIKFFENLGENYKVEIIKSIDSNETLSLYTQGNFSDLCRGPHVPSTGKIKAFKLTKVAGSYWRGDSSKGNLQRIYGIAFGEMNELNDYLLMLEEAEKRDHRKIGKQLGLFHFEEESPGMVFWHPKGFVIYQEIEKYIRTLLRENIYKEIKTPLILDRSLWEKTGHWQNFGENMFTTHSETREYAVKPMNCPGHVLIYNQGLKSYRDLPIRFSEFGSCHRNEPSGALHGLMRVRGFTQDDAHIFCTEEQIEKEASDIINLVYKTYKKFGFNEVKVKLSTRPIKRVGSDDLWDYAENALANALLKKEINYILNPGDGAFYGPKIEFSLKDSLGREWQCGTLQLDFNTPNRLGAYYIDHLGEKKIPVMLHRAIFGSLERFIAILIEHYAGDLPLWLAPIQMIVINISESQKLYAQNIQKQLTDSGFRCEIDISNEKIGYKIRENTIQKIPFLIIIGDKEVQNNQVTIRLRNGQDLGTMEIDNYIKMVQEELNS